MSGEFILICLKESYRRTFKPVFLESLYQGRFLAVYSQGSSVYLRAKYGSDEILLPESAISLYEADSKVRSVVDKIKRTL